MFEGDPQFLEVNLSVNIFSEQSLKNINVNLSTQNIRIEYANDLIKSLVDTLFAFRSASQLGGIKIAPNPEAFNRKVQLWAPWYLIKQAFTVSEFRDTSKYGFNKDMQKDIKFVEEENKKKSARQAQRGIANLDRSLKPLNFKIKLLIGDIYFSLNTNLDSKRFHANRNLLQIKTNPIDVIMIKHGEKLGLSFMGVQIMTQSSFELLFQFSKQMQRTLSIYLDNPMMKDAKKAYQEIVNKRITNTARNGTGTSLWNIDASTIRPSGASGFSFTDAPRFTGYGAGTSRISRPTFASTIIRPGGGAKGMAAPRNKPLLDFDVLKTIPNPQNKSSYVERDSPKKPQKLDNFLSEPRGKNRVYNKLDDEFDDDDSFNDTDEDIIKPKVKVGSPSTKPHGKALKEAPRGPNKHTSPAPFEYNENPAPPQPRTGPSRRPQRINKNNNYQMENFY